MTAPHVLLVHRSAGSDALRAGLEAAGCRVRRVATATAALGQLATEPVDCLVSEFDLPGDDGLALRAAVRRLAPRLPFVLLTDRDPICQAMTAGSPRDGYVRTRGARVADRLREEVLRLSEAATDAGWPPHWPHWSHDRAADESSHRVPGEPPQGSPHRPGPPRDGGGGRAGQDTDELLPRIMGLLDAVADVIAEATDRERLEARICEAVATEAGHEAAWIGELASGGSEFRLSATSGLPTEIDDPIPVASLPAAIRRVADTGEPHRLFATDPGAESRTLTPEAVGTDGLLVVPLRYGVRRYGLLGVYGPSDAFDGHHRRAVESLGPLIATGLHAIETARLLTTDHVTELRIALRDRSFRLSRIAAALDGPVERCGTTTTADGDHELYLTTEATDADLEALESLSFVISARIVAEPGDRLRLSVTMPTVPPDDILAEFGAVVTAANATADSARLTVEIPPRRDVRALLTALRSRYDAVDLQARTERERRVRRPEAFAAMVRERLTDRQQTALEAAYVNDYFQSPRPVDGGEIADGMGITRQTFHQHLRVAERKLVVAYIEAC